MAERRLEGEEKRLFMLFMRKMLQWEPTKRAGCREVFFSEWLLADLIESGVIEPPPQEQQRCDLPPVKLLAKSLLSDQLPLRVPKDWV